MPSPLFDTREIAAYRRAAKVLPAGPRLDGPEPPAFREPLPISGALPGADPFALPRVSLSPEPPLPPGRERSLEALLSLRGEAFVHAAYRAVLGRSPDAEGLSNFAGKLERGELTQVEVLGRLRYSGEGWARGRGVRGLFPRYARAVTDKMPVAGPLVRALTPAPKGGGRLPGLPPEEARLRADLAALAAQHNALAEALERTLKALSERDDEGAAALDREIRGERAARGQALGDLACQMSTENQNRTEAMRELIRRIDEERDIRGASVEFLNERLGGVHAELAGRLDEAVVRQAVAEELARVQGISVNSLEHRLQRLERDVPIPIQPSFYAALQNKFRGDGDLVRERLSVYLPYLQRAGVGTEALPILDLGCGRGEWLDLLRDRGFAATGVDDSRAAVEVCRRQGLNASLGDALQHLKGVRARSLGALTAFHILEHLDTGRVLALLSEARRTLVPGGLFVLEMPNPDNLRVAACYFYLDPTHRHPIPKELAQLFLERAGLEVRDVLPLNPFPPEEWPAGEGRSPDVDRMLYGPRDYGLIAVAPKKGVTRGV